MALEVFIITMWACALLPIMVIWRWLASANSGSDMISLRVFSHLATVGRALFPEDDDYNFGKWKQTNVYPKLGESFVVPRASAWSSCDGTIVTFVTLISDLRSPPRDWTPKASALTLIASCDLVKTKLVDTREQSGNVVQINCYTGLLEVVWGALQVSQVCCTPKYAPFGRSFMIDHSYTQKWEKVSTLTIVNNGWDIRSFTNLPHYLKHFVIRRLLVKNLKKCLYTSKSRLIDCPYKLDKELITFLAT